MVVMGKSGLILVRVADKLGQLWRRNSFTFTPPHQDFVTNWKDASRINADEPDPKMD
jgi:hypothetical protein